MLVCMNLILPLVSVQVLVFFTCSFLIETLIVSSLFIKDFLSVLEF